MLKMSELTRMRVYAPRKASRKEAKAGVAPEPKKFGRIHNLVFAPNSRRVVGVMVKRPDVAGMVKREDVFCSLDAIKPYEGGFLIARPEDGCDEAACRRLGLDLDRCIVWQGADVITEGGKPLGYVMDAQFSETTGEVDCFCAQEGSTASALVGYFDIPAAWVGRYDKGRMIVDNRAAGLELSGGLAGKAGEGFANAKEGAKEVADKASAAGKAAAEKAGAAASVAVDKGSRGLGKALGKAKVGMQGAVEGFQESTGGKRVDSEKRPADNGQGTARAVGEQLGKTKGMFSDFMREFKDASK